MKLLLLCVKIYTEINTRLLQKLLSLCNRFYARMLNFDELLWTAPRYELLLAIHMKYIYRYIDPYMIYIQPNTYKIIAASCYVLYNGIHTGPTFIKPDQRNPWIKDQLWNDLLSTILHLQLPNFVSCGRDKPSHMTQNLVTVGVKL